MEGEVIGFLIGGFVTFIGMWFIMPLAPPRTRVEQTQT